MMEQTILISLKRSRISIARKIIETLGNPSHILLLVSPEQRTVAISSSDAMDKRAHKIPNPARPREVDLHSKLLIQTIYRISDDWDENCSYKVRGGYIKGENIFRFHIDDATPFIGGKNAN